MTSQDMCNPLDHRSDHVLVLVYWPALLQILAFWQGTLTKLAERFPAASGGKTWQLLVESGLVLHNCLTASLPGPTGSCSISQASQSQVW